MGISVKIPYAMMNRTYLLDGGANEEGDPNDERGRGREGLPPPVLLPTRGVRHEAERRHGVVREAHQVPYFDV